MVLSSTKSFSIPKSMTLEALGWTCQQDAEFAAHAADRLIRGRVVSEHRTISEPQPMQASSQPR
jgi:hypothetical protein